MNNYRLPQPTQNFIVLIRCYTYNHCKYIEDALNGFISQETTFPFVCLVIDDASSDGEQDIIKEFLNRECDKSREENFDTDEAFVIRIPHTNNPNCTIVVYFLKENHYSLKKSKIPYVQPWRSCCKYEALCEGDDCWTDPLKLQKQVDILESDSNIVMVYSSYNVVDENNIPMKIKLHEEYHKYSRSGNLFARLLWKNYILTLTTCVRKEILESEIYKDAPTTLDYLIFLTAAATGDVAYIESKTGNYRITSTGAMATRHGIVDEKIEIISQYFRKLYCEGKIPLSFSFKQKFVINCIVLVISFNNFDFLKNILKRKKILWFMIPYALIVKIIKSIGDRYIKNYTHFNFYRLFFFDI